ncbi:MAG TPA: hypothetical protein PKV72_03490 [Candidatus Peribacteria bacterium]|nr:hypothetical protein [Candidatus Peribacteria bacterium]
MAVRSGLVEDWDEIDELQMLVARCEPMTKAEAGELIPKVRRLLQAGLQRGDLSIVDRQVCVTVERDREKVQSSVSALGLAGVRFIDRP